MLKIKINSVAARVAILVVIGIIFIYFYIFLGFLEQVFKIRKRIIAGRNGEA